MRAEYAVFQLGGGLWYEYWYGVFLQVVGDISTESDDVQVNRILLFGISGRNDSW